MFKERWRTTKLVFTAVAAAMLALPATGEEGQGRRGPGGFHGERGPGAGHGVPFLRELDLTEEQREQIRALFEEGESSGAHERLRAARQSLHEAVENGSDEGTIRQLAYEVGQAEGDAAVERARMQARVNEILTAEQRRELETLKQEAREEMEERRKRFEERRERRRNRERNPGSNGSSAL
jgi:Spy/CpxP family protein refolding chaperone